MELGRGPQQTGADQLGLGREPSVLCPVRLLCRVDDSAIGVVGGGFPVARQTAHCEDDDHGDDAEHDDHHQHLDQ